MGYIKGCKNTIFEFIKQFFIQFVYVINTVIFIIIIDDQMRK